MNMRRIGSLIMPVGILMAIGMPLISSAADLEMVPQFGHSDAVTSVAVSHHDKYILTGSKDGTAKLWDAKTGRELCTYTGHADGVYCVAFSPDDEQILTCSGDKTARLWELQTGRVLNTFRGHTGTVFSGAFNPKQPQIATGDSLGNLHLWESKTGHLISSFLAYGAVWALEYTPDGNSVRSASDYNISVRDTATKLNTILIGNQKSMYGWTSMAHTSDGKRIIAASRILANPVIWDNTTQTVIAELKGHTDEIDAVALSPDEKQILTGSLDNTAKLWDAVTWKESRTLRGHADNVVAVAYSHDSRLVVTGSSDSTAKVWDAKSGQNLFTLGGQADTVDWVAYSPKGDRLLTGTSKQGIEFKVKGTDEAFVAVHPHPIFDAVFSPDGKRFVTGSSESVIMWDAHDGRKLLELKHHKCQIAPVAFSPDGKYILGGGDDGTARLWDSTSGQLQRVFQGHSESVYSIAFRFDGKRILTGSHDKTARLWDTATGAHLGTLTGHTSSVFGVAFSPNGERALTGSLDQTGKIWDLTTMKELVTLKGNSAELYPGILCCGYRPDGKQVVTGSMDTTVKVWDPETGRALRTLNHPSSVNGVAYSPDGRLLLTGSSDGVGRLWDAETGQLVATLFALRKNPESWGPAPLREAEIGENLATLFTSDGKTDWLVATPEGLFDGSKGARNQICYQVGDHLNVEPVDRYFDDFYRPGLLNAILAGERPKPAEQISLPPAVRFLSPLKDAIVEEVTQAITVEATDHGGGADSIALFVNGRRIETDNAIVRVDPKTIRREFFVLLNAGENRFEARAKGREGSGEALSQTITLTYLRPVEKPKLFVVAIGVGEYAQKNLHLDYPARDAEAIVGLFEERGPALYADVIATTLTDADVTSVTIQAAFKALESKAQPQDVLVVLLAGHGKTIGQRYYFLPSDFHVADPDKVDQAVRTQGIPSDVLGEWMRPVKAQKRALIIDTCSSGGAMRQLLLSRSCDRDPFPFRGAVQKLNRSEGLFVIAAATRSAQAKEVKDLGHGLLTYALLAGAGAVEGGPLKDKAATGSESDKGVLDVLTWLNYGRDKSQVLSKLYFDQDQDVPIGGDGGVSFPLLPLSK